MKGFRKLVILGVLLVMLLMIIDSIEAGKKEPKTKENENKSINEKGNPKSEKTEKVKKSESVKPEKARKSKSKTLEENNKIEEGSTVETNKYKVRKGTKYTTKDSKTVEEGVNPKITKTYQKVKKYKVIEDEPMQNILSSKTKAKKSKSQVAKEETINEVYKTVKKTSQKKTTKEKDNIELIEENINRLNNEDTIRSSENKVDNNQSKKKYKLVEIVLEEDGAEEDNEGNETIIEVGSEEEEVAGIKRTESEEVIEKFKTTQTVKFPKTTSSKKLPPVSTEDVNEESINYEEIPEEDSEVAFEEDQHLSESCEISPDDPNRIGPKKLTLYVVEDEVDGEVRKRVISEEDGVSMCEVADLIKNRYAGLP